MRLRPNEITLKSNDCQLGIAYVWIKGRYNDVAVLHSLDQAVYGEVGPVGRDPVVERSDLVRWLTSS